MAKKKFGLKFKLREVPYAREHSGEDLHDMMGWILNVSENVAGR